MYDIQTEAFLRRAQNRDHGRDDGDAIGRDYPTVPVMVVASLILWVTVLVAAM